MNLLFVHAHFDDFEFSAAGTFELWRRRDPGVQRRILICTDGAAGHHALSREATARRRLAEQQKAADLGGFQLRLLRDPAGQPFREARLQAAAGFLPALWKEIREFRPDYLFCPPIPSDPLAGVHVDHLDVARAVRSVAYLINVPHAFTPEYPVDEDHSEGVPTPIILNTYDGYLGAGNPHDLAVDISSVVREVADLAWCHESQLCEWLPWVDRHHLEIARDISAWRQQFAARLEHRKRVLGIPGPGLFEVFQVTAWGVVPAAEQLLREIPGLAPEASRFDLLQKRLDQWRAAAGQ
jgi:LmbE family N-acetylglucosaminyl deacetylase